MLQIGFLRDRKVEAIARLSKRMKNAQDTVEKVLALDESRRIAQAELDNTAAQLNTLSKEIGTLYKSGQVEKANLLKLKTTDLKDKKVIHANTLNSRSEALQQLLYQIHHLLALLKLLKQQHHKILLCRVHLC